MRWDVGCCCNVPCTVDYMRANTKCCPGISIPRTLHATWSVTAPDCFVREYYLPPIIELEATIVATDPCRLQWISPVYEMLCQEPRFAFPPSQDWYLWKYEQSTTLQFRLECLPYGFGGQFHLLVSEPFAGPGFGGVGLPLATLTCDPFSLVIDPGSDPFLVPRFGLPFINATLPEYNPIKFQFPIPPTILLPVDEIPGLGVLCGQCYVDLPPILYPPVSGNILWLGGGPPPTPGTLVSQEFAVVLSITSIS